VAIVGSVGSGKTSFLSCMLGDIPKVKGRVVIHGNIAYVSQDAWILNNTVQDNICLASLGKPFLKDKYNQTLQVCQLQRDLEILPNGDLTEIGEKGINLRYKSCIR
jgi:ABC-type bacteriocin/lantibiotic exporter with double-glycine peptidase domain